MKKYQTGLLSLFLFLSRCNNQKFVELDIVSISQSAGPSKVAAPALRPTLILTGSGFSNDSQVFVGTKLGMHQAENVVVVPGSDGNELQFSLPENPGSHGKATVMVVDGGMTVMRDDLFSYYLGNIAFSANTDPSLLSGNMPTDIAVGDFNGDDRPDLAIVCSDTKIAKNLNIDILFAQENGMFVASPTQFSYGNETHPHIVTADFNHDQLTDLAFTDQTGTNLYVTTQVKGGMGDFRALLSPLNVGQTPKFITVADIDGDTYPDLVTANTDGANLNRISIFRNNQTGFQPPLKLSLPDDPLFMLAQDLNRDGKADLVVGTKVNPAIYTLQNKDGFTFGMPQKLQLDMGFVPQSGVAGILFSKNQQPDVAFVGTSPMNTLVSVWRNHSSGIIDLTETSMDIPIHGDMSVPTSNMLLVDVDLDGRLDLVVGTGAQISVFLRLTREDAVSSFQAPLIFSSGGSDLKTIAVGDFNSDGLTDFVAIADMVQHPIVFINTSN